MDSIMPWLELRTGRKYLQINGKFSERRAILRGDHIALISSIRERKLLRIRLVLVFSEARWVQEVGSGSQLRSMNYFKTMVSKLGEIWIAERRINTTISGPNSRSNFQITSLIPLCSYPNVLGRLLGAMFDSKAVVNLVHLRSASRRMIVRREHMFS
jgi:hypothetical protein